MARLISILSRVIGIFVLLLALSLSFNALTYINFDPTFGFLRLKQQAIVTGWYLPAYYSHVLVSALVLLIGLFQLYPTLGRSWPKVHRTLGYGYVIGVLFFSAPGGLIMSLFINRGSWVLTSFLLQGSLWFLFTTIAFTNARKHDYACHRKWMWRSYALTFAAISLRVYIFIFSNFFDLSDPSSYAMIAWMSWLLNLLMVEYYLRRFPFESIKLKL